MSATASFVTEIGEGFVGHGAHVAHVNTVLGALGGPAEQAWVGALAHPAVGHTPFVVVVQPGLAVKPRTVFVNKATIAGERHAELTWGAAQAGVARGVLDAVADGVVDASLVDALVLLAAVWVDPAARDADVVFENNAAATVAALRAGRASDPPLDALLAARVDAWNPYFRGR